MRELLLEGRVSWRSERSGRDRTLSIGPARILGLRRLVATALSLAAVTVLAVALVAAAAGAVAAGLGARWAAKRREQGLDDPVAVVQQRARQAKEWLDARRSPDNEVGGGDI